MCPRGHKSLYRDWLSSDLDGVGGYLTHESRWLAVGADDVDKRGAPFRQRDVRGAAHRIFDR